MAQTLIDPISRDFCRGERVTGYVSKIFEPRSDGLRSRIRVQLAPGVWGILHEKQTTFVHLHKGAYGSALEVGHTIEVSVLGLSSREGQRDYELGHPKLGVDLTVGTIYEGTVVRFHPSSDDRMLAFIRFAPGIDGAIFRGNSTITDLSIGDQVSVRLTAIDTERSRYSLVLA